MKFLSNLVWVILFFSVNVFSLTPNEVREIQDESFKITFSKKKIKLAGQIITVEVADTMKRRARGLMFRKSLPPNQGMLFDFITAQPMSFWMKNTLIPLSIGFFDEQRVLFQIEEMVPASGLELEPQIYKGVKPARYALEMPKDWFAKNKVELGKRFEFVP